MRENCFFFLQESFRDTHYEPSKEVEFDYLIGLIVNVYINSNPHGN